MSAGRVLARAPSNIAIVKYMGKRDSERNLPENPSLSLTLSQLCTFVEIRAGAHSGVRWMGEKPDGLRGELPRLDSAGEAKFLAHFARSVKRMPELLTTFQIVPRGSFPNGAEIRSANTFPAAAGIASSASSFAALTLAASAWCAREPEVLRARYAVDAEFRRALAALAREGSGSSCRSFEGPFVAWEGDRAERAESELPPLSDLVIVVSAAAKTVGSSEAHRRVRTSPEWAERPIRAENRFRDLRATIARGDFAGLIEIADADFRDMHRLFETSVPPFSYFAAGTREVLEFLTKENRVRNEMAITMDAGPNVHVLVPQSAEEFWRRKIAERFPQFPILVDREGAGAEFVVLEEAE